MLNNKPYNSGSVVDLQDSPFLFNVLTRQDGSETDLVFKLNGFQIRQDYKSPITNFNNFLDFFSYNFPELELRNGKNFIQVSQEYPDNRPPESLGWMNVFYTPSTNTEAQLTGWSQDQISKSIYVYGYTQPGRGLTAELGGLNSNTRVNDLGLFALRFEAENDVESSILDVDAESLKLEVNLSEEEWTQDGYGTWYSQSKLVHEGSYGVSPLTNPLLYTGNITIDIHNENRNADILFSVNIPQGKLVEEITQKNQFTSRELAGLFFGFGVTQGIEYFEFYDIDSSVVGPEYYSPLVKANYESSVRDRNKPLYEDGVLKFGVTLENLDDRYSRSLGFYDQSFIRVSDITVKTTSLDAIEIAPYFLQYSTSTNENDLQVYTFQSNGQDGIRSLRELITFDPNSRSPQQNQESSDIISARPKSLVDFLARLQSLMPRFLSNIVLTIFSSVPFISLLYILNYKDRLIEGKQNKKILNNLHGELDLEIKEQPSIFIEKLTIIYAITNLFLILNLSSLSKSFFQGSKYLSVEYTFLIFSSLLGLSIFESYKSPETKTFKVSRLFSGKLILFSFLSSALLTSIISIWWMLGNSLSAFAGTLIMLIFSILAITIAIYIMCIFIFVITSFSVGRWLSIYKVSAYFVLTIFFVSLPNIILLSSYLVLLGLPAIQNFGANDLSEFSNTGSLFSQYQDRISMLLLSLSTFLPRKPEAWAFVLLSTTISSYLGITILSAMAELNISFNRFLQNYRRIVRLVLFAVCFPIGVLLYESTDRLSPWQLTNDLAYDYLVAFLPYLLIPVIIYLLLENSKSKGIVLDNFSLDLGGVRHLGDE